MAEENDCPDDLVVFDPSFAPPTDFLQFSAYDVSSQLESMNTIASTIATASAASACGRTSLSAMASHMALIEERYF